MGKADDDGYWLAATDGYRALMRVGNGIVRERFPAKHQFTPGPVRFVLNRPFAEVWRRMSLYADGWVTLELTSEKVTLSSCDGIGEYTATEAYLLGGCDCSPAVSIAEPVRFSVNPDYLMPLLRYWPITVAYRDEQAPIVCSPTGAGWRYLLMPKR